MNIPQDKGARFRKCDFQVHTMRDAAWSGPFAHLVNDREAFAEALVADFGCNKVKHTDSTDLPVCSIRKAKNHKTMERLASWSKSSKGWFYGLKLHLSVDLLGRVVGLYFTTGNASDREVLKTMNKDLRGTFVADAGYVSAQLEREFFIENERRLLTCTRSNMKKLATLEDIELLKTRMQIEDNFGNLKQFHNLVSTVCRSIQGYLTNYLSSVCAYMIA